MSSGEAHNTRLGGMRQDHLEFKNEFSLQKNSLESSINPKCEDIHHKFSNSDQNL